MFPNDPSEQTGIDAQPTTGPDAEHRAGEQLGPYRLMQKIGEGGMGEVWVAEQREPVRRTVAVKVIKAGMQTRQVVARFEAERQALAMMDHPGIAKVLDAATTEKGRAYFVMEYVRGEPITTYCDRHRLSTRERLRLFTRVCEAVQHAHQKGIIHRDLKPSNVLVAIQDDQPVPKIIDFGIAKATAQRLTEQTLFTELGVLIGTPEYMSPEQAEMTGLDVDTRTDVYSLGVMLYELLAGALPFDPRTLRQAGIDAIRRHIRDVEPLRPSAKVSTLGEGSAEAARNRHTDSGRLAGQLKGDLDWITMKCLEKDRTRRYASASELAADITRHLEDRAVEAHAPSRVYRLRKLVRRNRPVFAAAAIVFVALAAALGASLWALAEANREAARSRQVAAFLQDMLQGVRPAVAQGRDTTMLREVLDRTAVRLDKELKGQPDVEADLRNTLAVVYFDLGQYVNAEAMFRRVVALRSRVRGREDPQVAGAIRKVGTALREQGKFAEAEAMFRQALAIQKKALGGENAQVADSLYSLGGVLVDQGRFAEAEPLMRDTLTLEKKVAGVRQDRVADAMDGLAWVLQERGRYAEAESLYREALALKRKVLGPAHPSTLNALANLGSVLMDQRKWGEAEAANREALVLQRKLYGNEHADVADSMEAIAQLLYYQGRFVEAEHLERDALALRTKMLGGGHPDVAVSLNSLASMLFAQGKLAEAEALERESLALTEKALGGDHPHVIDSLNGLANICRERGKLAEAESLQRRAVAMGRRLLGPDDPDVADAEAGLVRTLLGEEKFAEAEPMAREYLVSVEKRPMDWEPFHGRALLGTALAGEKRYAEAEPLLLAGYKGMKEREATMPTEALALREALQSLVRLYDATGRREEAAGWKRELEARAR